MAGWKVPGFTELRALGSGTFGEVVLARHDGSGTLVAIKYLLQNLPRRPWWYCTARCSAWPPRTRAAWCTGTISRGTSWSTGPTTAS